MGKPGTLAIAMIGDFFLLAADHHGVGNTASRPL
jgi:hypothetical protein